MQAHHGSILVPVSPRILAFVPSIGLVSETFITDSLAGLAATGADVTVAAGHVARNDLPSDVAVLESPLLHLTGLWDRLAARLGLVRQWSPSRDTAFDRSASRAVDGLLRRVRPDVAYLEYGSMLARLAAPLRAAGVPFVAHLHGHDVTASLGDAGYREALAYGLDAAAAVVVASEHMRRLAVLAGAPPQRVVVVPLGISLEGTDPVPWSERRRSPPRIVFFGRLVPKKHPVALVEAFAIVAASRPDVGLDVIGDGEERSHAEARAAARGVSARVRFHGTLPRRAGLAIVREAWIYAQHSVTSFTGDQEGFGLSIAEAAALELPVVSTWHNGIPEQVVSGETGVLVPEYDFEAMAAALLALLDDPDRCAALGAAGRRRVLSGYPPRRRWERLAAILAEACAAPPCLAVTRSVG